MTHPFPARFILYRREWDADKQKFNKVPCDSAGRNINHLDPSQWMTFDAASALATWQTEDPTQPHGVAWVLNGDGWWFLDMDNCHDGTGWSDAASAIYMSFPGALSEVSTSGKGLHIFGRCDPTRLTDRKHKWDGWCEWYETGRFVALTQGGLSSIGPEWVDRDWTDQLLKLVPMRAGADGELPDGVDPAYTGPENDDELIAMIKRSSSTASKFGQGVSAADLWDANVTILSRVYPSFDGGGGFDHSSADAALMSHLAFWTGKDMPRMDRLFRKSALMRDKYDKREAYRRETINGAVMLCKRVYDVPRRSAATAATAAASSEMFLTIPEMIEHFKGCVYIRDLHRVLVPGGAMLKPEQFNAEYGGHIFTMSPDGTKPSRKAFEAFTECMVHRFPRGHHTIFRPDIPPGTITENNGVNIYVKPNIRVKKGDISPLMDFLTRLMPVKRDREIILAYMAACVQYPGAKFQWAPVLQGTEGNGKSLLASCVIYAVSQDYSHEPRASQLTEKFNGFIEGKLFIVVEEIHMEGRREILDELKPMITNRRIEIRGMAQEKRMIDNVANWFFCTNYRDAVLKTKNDRRYCVFFTAQQGFEDIAKCGMGGRYFPDLYDWLRADGYAFIADFLMTYQIPDELNPATSCHRAPDTSSTEAAVSAATGAVESEIIEAIESGDVGFRGGWISSYCLEQLMTEKRFRISRPRMGTILRDLGYEQWGRYPRAIMKENGKRPVLWHIKGTEPSTDYVQAQGMGHV